MARIAGVDLPANKRVEIGLTYIYGIGRTRARKILTTAKVEEGIKVKDLSEDEVLRLQQVNQPSIDRSWIPLAIDLGIEQRPTHVGCFDSFSDAKG